MSASLITKGHIYDKFHPAVPFDRKNAPLNPQVASDHAWKVIRSDRPYLPPVYTANINNPAHAHHFKTGPWSETHLNPDFHAGYPVWNAARLERQKNEILAQIYGGRVAMVQEGYRSFLLALENELRSTLGADFGRRLAISHVDLDNPVLKDNVNVQATYYLLKEGQTCKKTGVLVSEYESDNAPTPGQPAAPKPTLRVPYLTIADSVTDKTWTVGNIHLRGCDEQFPKNAIKALWGALSELESPAADKNPDAIWLTGDFNTTTENIKTAWRSYHDALVEKYWHTPEAGNAGAMDVDGGDVDMAEEEEKEEGDRRQPFDRGFTIAPASAPSHINPNNDVVCYDNSIAFAPSGEPVIGLEVVDQDWNLVTDLIRLVNLREQAELRAGKMRSRDDVVFVGTMHEYDAKGDVTISQPGQQETVASGPCVAVPDPNEGIPPPLPSFVESRADQSTHASAVEMVSRLQRFLVENEDKLAGLHLEDEGGAQLDPDKEVNEEFIETVTSVPPFMASVSTNANSGDGNAFTSSGAAQFQKINPTNPDFTLDPMFILNLLKSPISSNVASANQESEGVRVNKTIFFKELTLSSKTVAMYRRFVAIDTTIYVGVINRLYQIFASHDMSFEDQEGRPVKSTVYNKPIVKDAVADFLIAALADLFIFGYTVVGVPKDLTKWVEKSFNAGVYNPALSSQGVHEVNNRAFNRLPQRTTQNTTDSLPYIHIDIDKGDLSCYLHRVQGGKLYMFEPTDPGAKALEKTFRTFVVVLPGKAPRDGELQTGLVAAYQEWSRYRLAQTNYLSAITLQSRPMVIVNQESKALDLSKLDPNTRAYMINRFPDFETTPTQESEAILYQIVNNTGPMNARFATHMAKQGMSRHKVIGALSQNRLAVAGAASGGGDGSGQYLHPQVPRPQRIGDITTMEHDRMEVDAVDIPRAIGEQRSNYLFMAPPGMKTANVVPVTPNQESVILEKKLYEEMIERLFELLIDPGAHSAVFEKSTGAKGTATQVEASRAEQGKTELTTLKMASYVFTSVYMEHGAVLDQLGIVNVITQLQKMLRKYRVLDALRDFISDQAELIGINFEQLIDYMCSKEFKGKLFEITGINSSSRKDELRKREAEESAGRLPRTPRQKWKDDKASGPQTALPAPPGTAVAESAAQSAKVANTVRITLDTLKNWEKIVKHAAGLEKLFMTSYRSMVQGSSSNLLLKFEQKRELMSTAEKDREVEMAKTEREEVYQKEEVQREEAKEKKKEKEKKEKKKEKKAAGGGGSSGGGAASSSAGKSDSITLVVKKGK